MTRSTGVKRLLAVLLCAALIASCITVAGVAAVSGAARGFEGQTVGADLALSNPYKNTMQVSDAQAHDGSRSLLVHTGSSGGSSRPQLLMQGASGQDFKTQAGGEYQISFWYYVPAEQNVTQLLCWFGAKNGNDKTAFSGWTDSDPNSKKGHLLSAAYSGTVKNDELLITPVAGQWTQVTLTVTDTVTTDGGYMIMGIAAAGEGNLDFYLDDITVAAVQQPVGGEGWSFENETAGANLSMNSNPMTVTSEQACDGAQSLKVVSRDNRGNMRAQLLLKDADGNTIPVKAGQRVTVSFWYYIQPDDTAISNGLSYWIAAADETTPFGDKYTKDAHKVVESSVSTTDLVKGKWTQLTCTGASKTDGFLRLGICPNSWGITTPIYLDSIVAEVEPLRGFNSFEQNAVGDSLAMTNTAKAKAEVTTEQKHTGAQALKIISNSNTGNGRTQLLVRDEQGQTVKLTAGESYLVSFWYYVPEDSTIEGLLYWLASANESTLFDGSYPKNDYRVYETATPISTSTTKGVWTQVSCVVVGDGNKVKSAGTLRLGICQKDYNNTNTPLPFYIDDISVKNLNEALDYGTNNVALFVGGGKGQSPDGAEVTGKSPVYTVDGKKYGAMRFLGQYTTTDAEHLSTVVIGGASYNIVKRGLAVDTATDDNTVLDTSASLKVEKTAGFDSCWTYDPATKTVKYSVLIAKINRDNLNTPLRYRSYMDIQVGNAVVTVYSAIHGSNAKPLTLNAVAGIAGYDNMAELF